MTTPAVATRDLCKDYPLGETTVHALRGVTIQIEPGSFVAIVGPSGSGKTTLMHCLAGLDRPTGGDVYVGGAAIGALSEEDVTIYRRRHIGVVFQFFNLLADLTVRDNVAVPLMLDGLKRDVIDARVAGALVSVGLAAHGERYPGELSGGEMQRTAIARALAVEPTLLLADEPTGNLDSANGDAILDLLRSACREQNRTVVLVTHDNSAAQRCDRILEMRDGRIVSDRASETGALAASRG